jgi:ectoine hydroxylase-related dioxygenase (phytanoyl-CoA dioxygenase family)
MELGTEQRFHSDTLYMAPRTRDKMAVAWIALEDIKPGAGALRYYAKSHLIEPFVFSNGGIAAKHEEMPEFDKYMAEQLRSENLEFTEFYPKAGDVFFWHSQLYHGGSPIEDSAATRRSMVLHFWRAEDVPSEMCLRVGRDDFILDPRYMPVATAFTPTGRKEGSVGEST